MGDLRVIVIGAVTSTARTITGLLRHNFNICGILGHDPENAEKVSGLVDLKSIAEQHCIDYKGFKRINNSDALLWARSKNPDVIFAVGFSQLLGNDWLNMPRLGCIGFHPTCLPKGRGRAPLAWSILEERCVSASFFLMGEGADDGPVFVSEVSSIGENDDASSVVKKMDKLIDIALDRWLPELHKGEWNPVKQDERDATWYGKRTGEDGWLNWNEKAEDIDRLIKASSHPHPGGFTFLEKKKIKIWKSTVEREYPIRGVVGRVLLKDEQKGYLVQCGIGLIWVSQLTFENGSPCQLKVGDKLGLNCEIEIHKIWNVLEKISN